MHAEGDDNSDDHEVDFESDTGPNKTQEEKNGKVKCTSTESNKHNAYSSDENFHSIPNGKPPNTSQKMEEFANAPDSVPRLLERAKMHLDNIKNVTPNVSNLDVNTIDFEQSEQFRRMQQRINELESWREQREKEDNAFKDTINLTFTKVLDKLVELDQNFQVLKAHQTSFQNDATTHRLRNRQKSFIKITTMDSQEIHEFPSDEEGNLSIASVNAVYPGI